MLRTLLESDARRPRRRAGLIASVAVHTLLIGGALAATASARARAERDPQSPPPIIHYTRREAPPAPRQPRREFHPRSDVSTTGQMPQDPGPAVTFFPDSLFRRPVGIDGANVPLDTASLMCLTLCRARLGGDSAGARGDGPATIATVDRAATLLAPPRPRYPERLRAAGVTGRVVVRFVVDTLGRVERATIFVRESSHELFAVAVRAALPALRFIPAEAGGRKVRMLVDLPFEFRLNE